MPQICPHCHQIHDGLPALGFDSPYHYNILSAKAKSEMAELSSDFCVIRHPEQTDRFIRVNLEIPLTDACGHLSYGIWVSLSEKSFDEYESEFKNNVAGRRYFGRICNELPDYDDSTLGLHVQVITKSDGLRPELHPYDAEHPIVTDWEKGIPIATALARIARCDRN